MKVIKVNVKKWDKCIKALDDRIIRYKKKIKKLNEIRDHLLIKED